MTMSEAALRGKLTLAMAKAVDETETYEAYFGEPTQNEDYGVARADGTMPGDMLFLWEFAGFISDYIASHGIDVLDIVEQVGNLFVAYQAVKPPRNDFDDSEKQKIKAAVAASLRDLLEPKKEP
ncbi:hypothetical protein [Cohaesibacter celericrescens]|nr:hypothetical protein [Cohaesibacter celericrescens]